MQEIQFRLVCLIFALISAGSGSAQGAPNTLSHPQGKKFRPVNQMWIEYIKDIRQVTIYRAKSFQLKTCEGKTGGAHDRGMKRLFTPCYDHLQSCASTFLLSSVITAMASYSQTSKYHQHSTLIYSPWSLYLFKKKRANKQSNT